MPEHDPYKEIVDELFIRGLSAYLDKHEIGKKIDAAIAQAVEFAAPRKSVLSPKEACIVFDISRATFDAWIAADDLPAIRRGTKVLVPIPAIRRLLECPDWFERHGLDRERVMNRISESRYGSIGRAGAL